MFVQLTRDYLGRKAGERLDLSESDAAAFIARGAAEPVRDDVLSPLIQRSIDSALAGIAGGLQSTFDAALRDFSQAQTKSRKGAAPALFGEGRGGDPKQTFGRFLLAVRHNDRKALDEMGSSFVEWDDITRKAAMSTQTGTSGGYLVPIEFVSRLMALVAETSIVRPRATIIPMSSRSCQIPARTARESVESASISASGESAGNTCSIDHRRPLTYPDSMTTFWRSSTLPRWLPRAWRASGMG